MYANKTPPKNTGMTMAENSEYMTEQYQEILLGKEEGLDISLYSNPELNWLQMEQIRMGIKDKVDVSAYADPSYSYETMKQIRLSFYSSTDLSPYLGREIGRASCRERVYRRV